MIEILCGVLTGAQVLDEVKLWLADLPGPLSQGHAFIAIDVGKIVPLDFFKARMDHVIRQIRNSPKAAGADRIYLPGEMEWERHDKAVRDGMLLPDDVILRLEALAAEFGLDMRALLRQN
jgi:LDH2 family malate/lactate/ureidoglycolate dehydrogenase